MFRRDSFAFVGEGLPMLYWDYYFSSFAVIIPFLAIFVQSMLLSNDVYEIVTCYIAT